MFLFHKSVEQYRRPKTFDQYCIKGSSKRFTGHVQNAQELPKLLEGLTPNY